MLSVVSQVLMQVVGWWVASEMKRCGWHGLQRAQVHGQQSSGRVCQFTIVPMTLLTC